jgi:tRNA(Arg) A34 adenosine deaminase TadA
MERKKFMDRAIELSLKGSSEGKGGPFGAVIVKNFHQRPNCTRRSNGN